MFKKPFNIKLREKRLSQGITQKHLAEQCGMQPQRISNLECGHRSPSKFELQKFQLFLGLGNCSVAPKEWHKHLKNNATVHSPIPEIFSANQDRPTYIRYRACLRTYPKLVNQMERLVLAREDFELCECLCNQIACESALESLFILYLLAKGAIPGLHPPAVLGRTPFAIVDDTGWREVGLRPRACLILEQRYYFFQVSFRRDRTARFDILRWDGTWSAIEINGSGHNDKSDFWKRESFDIPVYYLSELDLIRNCEKLVLEKSAA